jgi:transposase, IS30 family
MSWIRLSLREREVIEKMSFSGKNKSEIAAKLGRHPSTISREFSRNAVSRRIYDSVYAQVCYDKRKHAFRVKPVTENRSHIGFVRKNIRKYSPDVISKRAVLEKTLTQISTESIYRIIYDDRNQGGNLWTYLPSKRKSRKRHRFANKDGRGMLQNQVSIHLRPPGARNKSRNGHFEGDTIVGTKNQSMIFTSIDRKNSINFSHKLKTRDSNGVFDAVKLMKESLGKQFKSLTVDNGKEFACHEKITKELKVKVYFADIGKPYQRGKSENFNRLLRRYFPKGIDLNSVPWQSVRRVMNIFNNTPRKSLNYRTPFEMRGFRRFCAILN